MLQAAISAIDIALHDIKGKAWACRSMNCSEASSATAFRLSPPPGTRQRAMWRSSAPAN